MYNIIACYMTWQAFYPFCTDNMDFNFTLLPVTQTHVCILIRTVGTGGERMIAPLGLSEFGVQFTQYFNQGGLCPPNYYSPQIFWPFYAPAFKTISRSCTITVIIFRLSWNYFHFYETAFLLIFNCTILSWIIPCKNQVHINYNQELYFN